MAIGLSEQELNELLSWGNTEQEIAANISGLFDNKADQNEQLVKIISSLEGKVLRIVLENNRRINDQLISAGVHLPD